MVRLYLAGICPRSEELVAATRGLDRGRVSQEEVEAVRPKDAQDLIALQQEVGCDAVLDGLLTWQDLFRPLVEAWDGLETGPLTRWFDNNTFFRQPVLVDELGPHPLEERHVRTDLLPEGTAWKAVLPGPYTFLDLAEDRHYHDPGDALAAVASGLAEVTKDLVGRGIQQVQFQEPSLAVHPPDEAGQEGVRKAYEALQDGAETAVHLFFGPAAPLLPFLNTLPVDLVGVDLYQEPPARLRKAEMERGVALGCVDARNSLLEEPEEVAARVVDLVDALGTKEVVLSPNCDLEFLPRSVAQAKMRILGQAKARVAEVV